MPEIRNEVAYAYQRPGFLETRIRDIFGARAQIDTTETPRVTHKAPTPIRRKTRHHISPHYAPTGGIGHRAIREFARKISPILFGVLGILFGQN